MIQIRKAQAQDRGEIGALLRQSWLENWAPHVKPESLERFHAEDPVGQYLDGYLLAMFVAISAGHVVGMAHVDGDMLHAVHVARVAQGRGVGSELLAHAEAIGARRLEVRLFNSRAHRFYLKRGWRESRRYMASEMGTLTETIELVRQL